MRQIRFEEIVEFEEFVIKEKIAKVALETAKGLSDRPDDKVTVTYVKNAPKRIIEWVKTADGDWKQRQRLKKDQYWAPTEVVEFIDLRQINRECPPNEAFVNQGTTQPRDAKFPSDKAIFRECIKGKDGKIFALELKTSEKQVFWKTTKWLMKKTGLSNTLCNRLSKAFTRLSFNRKTVMEIIDEIDEKYIEYLEFLVKDLPKVPPLHYDPKLYYDKGVVETDAWICAISEGTLGAAFPEEFIQKTRNFIESEVDDETEETMEDKKESKAETFTVHELHFQEDGCSHEFLSFLKSATKEQIRGIMQGFFGKKLQNGTTTRPRFWYLTPSQKAQAWIYINERREKLGILNTQTGLIDFTK